MSPAWQLPRSRRRFDPKAFSQQRGSSARLKNPRPRPLLIKDEKRCGETEFRGMPDLHGGIVKSHLPRQIITFIASSASAQLWLLSSSSHIFQSPAVILSFCIDIEIANKAEQSMNANFVCHVSLERKATAMKRFSSIWSYFFKTIIWDITKNIHGTLEYCYLNEVDFFNAMWL